MNKKMWFEQEWWLWLVRIVCIILIAGLLIGESVCRMTPSLLGASDDFSLPPLFPFSMYAAFLLQVIIREGGHLVFGLLTGYRFLSFRIFGLVWVRENGRLRLKRQSIAGTAGQCLMAPPERTDGKRPFVLYNIGSVIANGSTALLSLALYVLCFRMPGLSAFLWYMFVAGLAFALENGVPTRTEQIDNDGYNLWAISQSGAALDAFYLQLRIVGQIAGGVRLKDMPEEWFTLPAKEELHNSMIAVRAAFACNRLMDKLALAEAYSLMVQLLCMDTGLTAGTAPRNAEK